MEKDNRVDPQTLTPAGENLDTGNPSLEVGELDETVLDEASGGMLYYPKWGNSSDQKTNDMLLKALGEAASKMLP